VEVTLLTKLKEIQSREGLTDSELAKRLNCSRQLYQGIRTGKIPLGSKVLKGISIAFPELQADILLFLASDAKNCPNTGRVGKE
jgi:transcriptional regulator with XRE-family HTH domain